MILPFLLFSLDLQRSYKFCASGCVILNLLATSLGLTFARLLIVHVGFDAVSGAFTVRSPHTAIKTPAYKPSHYRAYPINGPNYSHNHTSRKKTRLEILKRFWTSSSSIQISRNGSTTTLAFRSDQRETIPRCQVHRPVRLWIPRESQLPRRDLKLV
jgi:hypothetical protein